MSREKNEKIKISTLLSVICLLLGLCTFMGIQAITNTNQQKFNLGITSTAETKLEVEMLVGSQFEKIYSSLDPSSVDYSAVYINSIVDNTINLNNNNLPLSNNSLSFKFYNYDTENAVKVYVNQQEKTVLSKATSSNQPSSSSTITISDISQNAFLGTTLLALEFVLAHEVTFVYNDDTTSNQTQIITSGNTLTPPTPTRTGYDFLGWFIDSGCTQAFDPASLIMQDTTLYAGWSELTYKIFSYSETNRTKPAMSDTDYYEYYMTFGEYPQSEVTLTESEIANLELQDYNLDYATLYNGMASQVTLVTQPIYKNPTTNERYAKVTTDGVDTYYLFQPLNWIILGGCTGENYEEYYVADYTPINQGYTATLFTTSNRGTGEGQWIYENGKFAINGQEVKSFLLISEQVIESMISHNNRSTTIHPLATFLFQNFYPISWLTDYFMNSFTTDHKFINTTTVPKTRNLRYSPPLPFDMTDTNLSSSDIQTNELYSTNSKFFTFGINYYSESYTIETYFSTDSSRISTNLKGEIAPYWLRSYYHGGYKSDYRYYISNSGTINQVSEGWYDSYYNTVYGVRPMFCFNLNGTAT